VSRPFVVDRNVCHFLWCSGVAGEGLRSVGADGELPTKSVCSILPNAHYLRAGVLRGSGLFVTMPRGEPVRGRRCGMGRTVLIVALVIVVVLLLLWRWFL